MSEHDHDQGAAHASDIAVCTDAQLQALNLDYLRLLALENQESAGYVSLPTIEPSIAAEFSMAAETSLEAMAKCGVSLFTLSLHNVDLWWRIAASGAHEHLSRRYANYDIAEGSLKAAMARRGAFTECALFYAWHLAQFDRDAARMHLGMPQATAEIMSELRIWQLRCVALKYPQILAPRWPGNPCFWPELVRYLHDGDRRHIDYARLLAAQLLAQELEPSSIERLTSMKHALFKTTRSR